MNKSNVVYIAGIKFVQWNRPNTKSVAPCSFWFASALLSSIYLCMNSWLNINSWFELGLFGLKDSANESL
jgi:lipid-A-disaccharide synthase-like uncharacterized protein